jgi:hypothetical protein
MEIGVGTKIRVAVAVLATVVLAAPATAAAASIWQNPALAPNPGSNIHNDSFLSDNYATLGPGSSGAGEVLQINQVSFTDPETGLARTQSLGECAAVTFDQAGNVISICAGLPVPKPGETTFTRSLVTLDRDGKVLAYASFVSTSPTLREALSDFGGAGYFYLDNLSRPVVALPDGKVVVYERVDSLLSDVDRWAPARTIQVTGEGGAVPIAGLDLYALMPAPDGSIWFTTGEGVVGTIAPDGSVRWVDLNRLGRRLPGRSREQIANSHAIGRDGSAYVLTTHALYRLKTGPNGRPNVVWRARYEHGVRQKPGQVSHGSGTSPTLFEMGRRTLVAIADNARRMNVLVFRTEARLSAGESRLFASAKPFGREVHVSDENSLIWAPRLGGRTASIFAENNWGNTTVRSTSGRKTTEPGFARMVLLPNGKLFVAARNDRISVPSVVSKASQKSHLVYTYEKRPSGWFLTALRERTLAPAFSVRVGNGASRNNNYYSGLSLDPDGKTVWIGTTLGLTRVVP